MSTLEIKSISCESCGAGLNNFIEGKCKCDYCGNHNLLLENGKTVIFNTPKRHHDKKQVKELPLYVWILVFLACPFFAMIWLNRIYLKK